MPKTSPEEPDRMYGHEETGRAALRLPAAAPRKTGASVWRMAKAPRKSEGAVYGWLTCMRERGAKGRFHDKHPGAARKLNRGQLAGLRADPTAGPSFCGLPSGTRSARRVVDRAKKKCGATCGIGGISRLLHRPGFVCVKPRPRNPGAAPREGAEAFKIGEREEAPKCAGMGCTVVAGDASPFAMGLRVKRGWYPKDGDGKGRRPTAPSALSRGRFNTFGVPGRDGFRHKFRDGTDGDGFPDFVRELYEKCGKTVPYPDNAGHHKSEKVNGCIEEGFGDGAALKFFPPYTPEPNPVGIRRRGIKKAVADEPFDDAAEMKDAVSKMPESGEIKTVKTFDWPVADA